MAEPLPTLADIDAELARAHATKAQVRGAIAANDEETRWFLLDLVTLDESVDALLEMRSRVAALPVT